MARARTLYRCEGCGAEVPKWSGRCDTCGDWNSLAEVAGPMARVTPLVRTEGTAVPTAITELDDTDGTATPTGLGELDRVLGGGLVAGSVTLLGGEPGVGKSTVVLQMLASRARAGDTCLYVTGEESAQQVGVRARRLGALDDRVLLLAETSMPQVLGHIDQLQPALCVVDSIQTMYDPASESAPGTASQVRDCAHQLVSAAKANGTTIVLVGHVTKEGSLAGPRVLEHVVDTVLTLEGDRHGELRVLRAAKHRFGSTQEIGLFSIGASGFESVPDPSAMFLADRRPGLPGSVVAPAIEGHRPLLVEVQALVVPTQIPQPRRSAQGLDSGRLSLLLAVLQRRAEVSVGACDVYAMAVGGVKVSEPGVDLAVCLAVASSAAGTPLPSDIVACGEVGLGGELRRAGRMDQRLSEAARHGFSTALVPMSAPETHSGIQVLRTPTIDAALAILGL